MKSACVYRIVSVVILVSLLLAACTAPEPEVVEVTRVVTEKETVVEVETKEVEVTRIVTEKETVVETVVEEKLVSSRGQDGTLRMLYSQAASILNPFLSNGTKDIEAAGLILEPLARYDESGQLVPWLVDEIPTVDNGGVSEDLMSITWKLREGILWSDGTPFTAEDVVFTWEYCVHPEMGCVAAAYFADIESVEALDDLTVRISFSVPKPFPYAAFVGWQVPIFQKAQFENCLGAKAQECTEQNFSPIGTGPFKVKEFKPNDVVTYQVNEYYRDPNKPNFSEVVIKGGADAVEAARAVLVTGEADWTVVEVEPDLLAEMEAVGGGKVLLAWGTPVERLILNFTDPDPALGENRSKWTPDNQYAHPFLADIAVRRALSLAIDRNVIQTTLLGKLAKPVCDVVPAPAIYAQTVNNECLTQDIELANQILDEAGWVRGPDGVRRKDGVRLSILWQTTTSPLRVKMQAMVKQWWSEIGVETELRNIDGAIFFGGDPASPDTYSKFYADIEMYVNSFDGVDPETYFHTWSCSEICDESNNWICYNVGRWCSAEYDALLAELAVTANMDRRIEISKELNNMVVQNYVEIPLTLRAQAAAHANSLLGLRHTAFDSRLWNIADWSRASQ